MSVVVANLQPAFYAQEVALAAQEAKKEVAFLTTLTPDGGDLIGRVLKFAGQRERRGIYRSLRPFTRTYPWREAVRLLDARISSGEIRRDKVFHWALDGFDEWVARQMKPPVEMVYGYETQCLKTFTAARAEGIRTVLDLPSLEHDHVENLLHEEYAKFPELETATKSYFRRLQSERTARRRREFALADLVVANSRLTAETWAKSGLDGSKIRVVPLGGPDPDPRGIDSGSRGQGPLRLVWAGKFSIRKGAHYLLRAWQRWKPDGAAVLDVFGPVSLPQRLLDKLPSNIVLHGAVTRERVLQEFLRSDLLVFPTLCDGFGLVVTEAMSRGLPVLTTPRAGASDLIEDSGNGLMVEAANAEALAEALAWAADNRSALAAMRSKALGTASRNLWSDYRRRLREAMGLERGEQA